MSAAGVSETSVQSTKPKKSKKKKKPKTPVSEPNGDTAKVNGLGTTRENESEDEIESPMEDTSQDQDFSSATGDQLNGNPSEHGTNTIAEQTKSLQTGQDTESSEANDRLEAAARERDALRVEVTELRKSLETIQQRHEEEAASFKQQIEETQSGKEHAEGRYHKLLDQINNIKSKLGERIKADAEELSGARSRIEELEKENDAVKESNAALQTQIGDLTSTNQQHEQDISSLRGRSNLSQQNWAKERDDLVTKEAQLREEFEDAKQAMQDWEVLAREERSQREALSDRLAELEDQLATQRSAYEQAASARDSQSVTVDGLQRALQDIQDARKQELREVVENSQSQIAELRKQLKEAEESSVTAQANLETTKHELERALPFEREVREKNLLIGKLRHEAVILNDHLTKALRFLKKGKPEDTVDRRLITNHLLQFFALDRTDAKKFQVLQLISALLGWTEEQNEAAGLARPGGSSAAGPGTPGLSNNASGSSLRLPLAPFRRVSSSASIEQASPSMTLNNIFTSPSNPSNFDLNQTEPTSGMVSPGPARNESLAELWGEFLEREAAEGQSTSTGQYRVPPRGESISPPTSGMVSPQISTGPPALSRPQSENSR